MSNSNRAPSSDLFSGFPSPAAGKKSPALTPRKWPQKRKNGFAAALAGVIEAGRTGFHPAPPQTLPGPALRGVRTGPPVVAVPADAPAAAPKSKQEPMAKYSR